MEPRDMLTSQQQMDLVAYLFQIDDLEPGP